MAFQFRRSRASCRTAIDAVIGERPEILSQDFPSQFRQLLTKAAQATGFLEGPVTVVIDGLDECNSARDQVTLLELIFEAVKMGNMRFFIASRPEQQIHTFFHRPDVAQHTYHVRLDEETFQTSHDIKTFLREEFARIRRENPDSCHRLPNGEEWPGERVLDHLTLGSDSQFMFPTLAVGFIDTPYFPPERQLQILMEAPPSGAFSALDNLYHKILSRQPPAQLLRGEADLCEYQEVVMGILRVIIAWSGDPLSAADIAMVLDKPSDVVQRIVRGPMRTLFKFHTSGPDSPITLCHKSLRDYLLARDRSREYFIPSAEEDDLFVAILSRRPTTHPPHPNIQGLVMDVLSFLCTGDAEGDVAYRTRSVPTISEFLDVDCALVDYVINIAPTRLLVDVDRAFEEEEEEDNDDDFSLCTWSFQEFLRDRSRSGPFFLSNERTDTLYIQALSRPPPSVSPYSVTRDTMLDVLATLPMWHDSPMTIDHISAFLEVDSGLVEHIVTLGPAKWLVSIDEDDGFGLKNNWVEQFLEDSNRSKEFFISPRRLDPVFIRLLSKQSSSESALHNTLMDVLTAMSAVGEGPTIPEIAFLLGIDPTLVEGVVKLGPTSLLFRADQDKVSFSIPRFAWFLQDSSRSGPFFISSSRMDALFIEYLSRGPPPDLSNLYSRNDMLNILAVLLALPYRTLPIRQIAAFIDVDCNLVEYVVKCGAEKCLFEVENDSNVKVAGYKLQDFLHDAERSGHFFISDRRLDPFLVKLLSRPPPNLDPLHPEVPSHEIIPHVLAAILAFGGNLTVQGIASVIGVDSVRVEGVVTLEAMKVLLATDDSKVRARLPILQGFLQDATRSGNFFVPQNNIDSLFLHILSNGTTSPGNVHPHSQELLMDILSVMTIKNTASLAARDIATFLDVNVALIEAVASGPYKQLFRVNRGQISLSSELLGLFLQDVNRAGDFCITEARMDDLFIRFLSRQLPPNPPYSHTQHVLKCVLCVMAHSPEHWTVSLLSAFLDVDTTTVEGVVNGPSRLLFSSNHVDEEDAIYCPTSLRHFLKDVNRSGKFFISDRSLDPFFSRILSSPLSSSTSDFRPQDVLRDVLTLILVASGQWLTVPALARALNIDACIVESIVKPRLPRLLLHIDWGQGGIQFATSSLTDFLRDADRSGEFCITDSMMDTLFIRILSLPPPSYLSTPPSKSDIIRIMAVILASPEPLTMPRIAALLGVDCIVVEGVVELVPAKVLFTSNGRTHKVELIGPFLKPFLHDPNRSGEFYIPTTITLDDIPKRWPQHPSTEPIPVSISLLFDAFVLSC